MAAASRAYGVAVVIGILLGPSLAHAQSAEAEMLFREGRKLVQSQRVAEGCAKLEASEKLESSVGTLLNLGDCREKLGRHASAWAAFEKASAMARRTGDDGPRMLEARNRAARLESKLVRLSIVVPAPVDGLVVHRGPVSIERAVWGVSVPVDPDKYAIVAEAPGYQTWRGFAIVDGKRPLTIVTIPALVRTPEELPQPLPASAPSMPPRDILVRSPGTWTTTRKFAIGIGVVGVAALGTGLYLGVSANELQDRAAARCPLVACADPQAIRWNDQARTRAQWANVGYAAGGISLATAAVMWWIGAPEHSSIVPTVGPQQVGIALAGSL